MKKGITLAVFIIAVLQALDIPICHASNLRLVLDDVTIRSGVDQPKSTEAQELLAIEASPVIPTTAFEPLDPDGRNARVSDEPVKNLIEEWPRESKASRWRRFTFLTQPWQ